MKTNLLFTFAVVFGLFSSQLTAQSESKNENKFTSEDKKYNDWDVAVFFGVPMIQGSDLNTLNDGTFNFGYDVELNVTKQITHAFGLSFQGNLGQTNQTALGTAGWGAETNYISLALMGDINFSNLLRRADNRSPFRWALHGYGGIGMLQYDNELFRVNADGDEISNNRLDLIGEGEFINSFFLQGGAGLRYKISKRIDVEFKGMYVYTGDEEFDGSSSPEDFAFDNPNLPEYFLTSERRPYDFEEGRDDSFWRFSVGAHFKIGKHDSHLAWVNPISDLYDRVAAAEAMARKANDKEVVFCQSGDQDDDGICDDWDRQLDTPKGAVVSGPGVALDTDKDGIIDLDDACPTFPGKPNEDPAKHGCPEAQPLPGGVQELTLKVEFLYNKSQWYPEFDSEIEKAYRTIVQNPDANFILEGHTDAVGSASYNLRLSQRRADAIKQYLVNRGIDKDRITAVGRGETEIINGCFNGVQCSKEKNKENRRVVLKSDRPLTIDE